MQIALETAHQRAGKVKSQASRLCVGLKGMKEPLRVSHPAPGVTETNRYPQTFLTGAYRQLPALPFLHGALAVLGKVQEHLHQTLAVCPNRRQVVSDLPVAADPRFAQG
jgi:hypothetical protein